MGVVIIHGLADKVNKTSVNTAQVTILCTEKKFYRIDPRFLCYVEIKKQNKPETDMFTLKKKKKKKEIRISFSRHKSACFMYIYWISTCNEKKTVYFQKTEE